MSDKIDILNFLKMFVTVRNGMPIDAHHFCMWSDIAAKEIEDLRVQTEDCWVMVSQESQWLSFDTPEYFSCLVDSRPHFSSHLEKAVCFRGNASAESLIEDGKLFGEPVIIKRFSECVDG